MSTKGETFSDGPIIAAIETSTLKGSLALLRGECLVFSLSFNPPAGHSKYLMPALEAMAGLSAIPIERWQAVAVSSGPGSFTGLRIGMATAKAICLGLTIPLYGIPTLDALAHRLQGCGKKYICTIIDARKGQLFTSLYRLQKNWPRKITHYKSLFPEDLPSLIPIESIFTGDGVDIYGPKLEKIYGSKLDFAPLSIRYPDASEIARFGLRKYNRNKPSELIQLTPCYVRPSDAEINWCNSSSSHPKSQDSSGDPDEI